MPCVRGLAGLAVLTVAAACGRSPEPTFVLWAWERPEDLRFLAPGDAEVAVLAGTLQLSGDRVRAHPRSVPLLAREGIPVTAVVRIELQPEGATLDERQRARVAAWIRELARRPRYAALQIDFDAPQSARPFYRDLLASLRPDFPRLSMTALASWCFEPESWLRGAPVDEVVPMLFRMGPDGGALLARLEREGRFPEPLCRAAVGMATDEPLRWRPGAARLYFFHPRPWTRDDFTALPRGRGSPSR